MSLSAQLSELIQACFTGIWIESHEHEDALTEIAQLCNSEKWNLATWHLETGLSVSQASTESYTNGGQDPLAAIRALQAMSSQGSTTVLVLQNFHKFMQSNEIVQALARQLVLGKQHRTFIVILSPVVNIPVELEKMFLIVEHQLPSREQLAKIAASVATEPGEMPAEPDCQRTIDAAVGLTRYEAEGAFSLSLVRHGQLRADILWEQKAQLLKKQGQLSLHRGTERFDKLGGLDSLKAFCLRALRRQTGFSSSVRPRGVLLLSPPGCGKSQFAKSLGNETGRPTLTLDIGSLMGSLVGESERNLRQALRIFLDPLLNTASATLA